LRDREIKLARHARRGDASGLQVEPFEQRDREAQADGERAAGARG
jgi:hypothetical protein